MTGWLLLTSVNLKELTVTHQSREIIFQRHIARFSAIWMVIFALVAGWVCPCSTAVAQTGFPNKPIRFIQTFAPGGPGGVVSRIFSTKMSEILGQPIVVDNRAGAGGAIGTDYVAEAEPDGYTLLIATTANATNETLSKTLRARLGRDLIAVAALADTANILVVTPSLGVKTLTDLIQLAKREPGLPYASAGIGSSTHLSNELFNQMAGVSTTPVHYRGGGEALKDLLSGEVKMMFSSIAPVLGLVQEGKLVGVATTGKNRDAVLPDLPTMAEAGLPGFETRVWFGIAAQARTPKTVIDQIASAANQAAQDRVVANALAKVGFQPLVMNQEEFANYYNGEREKWGQVIARVGIDRM
jgi:tripartite-type tricarboxylate transporter receptor subunit TctC